MMGSIDLVALIKYMWAALPPVMWKAWGLIDMRFRTVEDDVKEVKEDIHNVEAALKVLVERSENQEKRADDMSLKIDKIYEILMNMK